MLHIFICEDRPEQLEQMEQFVNTAVMEQDIELGFAVSMSSPTVLLDYIKQNSIKNAVYFLDVDLQHEINGIELGAKIRDIDVSATIVFITTHSEMAHLVFEHKVEAMEYIIKGDPERIAVGVSECIKLAYQRYLDGKHSQSKFFRVRYSGAVQNVPYDDILYFETNVNVNKMLILHTVNGDIDFRGALRDVTSQAPEFFACHNAVVVNPEKIRVVHKNKKMIELSNGELIPVSKRRLPELLRIMWNNSNMSI